MHLRSLLLMSLATLCTAVARPTIQLDQWRFHHSETDQNETETAAEDWQAVTIPHDWSWEAGPREDGVQIDKGGYRIGGFGTYQTTFTLPESWADKRTTIVFDGAYHRSEVFINGKSIGTRHYGFISFDYDITEHLQPGENTVTVKLDCSLEPSSRWYHPCGLYAPVHLVATNADSQFVTDSPFVTTPEITKDLATVRIAAAVTNPAGLSVDLTILDHNEETVASTTLAAAAEITGDLTVPIPKLWSPDSPTLYTAVLSLHREGQPAVDELRIPFGIRTILWDKATGFSLNGESLKLQGVCEHLAAGPVGGAWPAELIEWKLRLLKSMGCNAIRTAHNPQVPAFYDLCDRLGLLVMNEAFDGWSRKAPEDYGAHHFAKDWKQDLGDFIRRDRNHPSVIIWSVGNETHGSVAPELVALCHEHDPTRLVTSGGSASAVMDVIGINGPSEFPKFFEKGGPLDKPFVATEAPHTWQVRGFYKTKTWYRDGFNQRNPPFVIPDLTESEIFTNQLLAPAEQQNRKQILLSSYDNATVRITSRQHWQFVRDLPWITGFFRWTGFDYPGEAGYVHGGWPFHAFAGGALDLAGFPKDLFYFYQSQWTEKPMVHLFPHWTHPNMEPGTLIPVQAYSNAEEVELFLNGKSLGIDKPGTEWQKMQCQWMVPWTPGKLTAIARTKGEEVARMELSTASAPSQLSITAENAAPGFPILTISTVDEKGNLNPYGENTIFVSAADNQRILSFENGHPADTDPPVATERRAFMGLARLFLKTTSEEVSPPLVIGAILGERRQLTSDKVAIDVQRITAAGASVDGSEIAIHYTTDGTEPTTASPLYSAPFAIPPTATVKAVAYIDQKPVLTMVETFAPDLGLDWSDPENAIESSELKASTTALQAEQAKFSGGVISNKGRNFYGAGFLDLQGGEGSIQFYQENDGANFSAKLVIRYAHNDPKRQRPMTVLHNERELATIKFPSTSSWNDKWSTVKTPIQIVNGANTIILKTTGQSAPNIDQIDFE